jgi:hypothetical protein
LIISRIRGEVWAGDIVHKITGERNAFGGFGYPGQELTGSGDMRGEDLKKVGDRQFLGALRHRRAAGAQGAVESQGVC